MKQATLTKNLDNKQEETLRINDDFAEWLQDERINNLNLKIYLNTGKTKELVFNKENITVIDHRKQVSKPKINVKIKTKTKSVPKSKIKSKFKIDDIVIWTNKEGNSQNGTVLKIYETTFGSCQKGIALQIQLDDPYNGRTKTTIKADKCEKAYE